MIITDKNVLIMLVLVVIAGAAMVYNNYMITSNIDKNFQASKELAQKINDNAIKSAEDRSAKANATEQHFITLITQIKSATDSIDKIGNATAQKQGIAEIHTNNILLRHLNEKLDNLTRQVTQQR